MLKKKKKERKAHDLFLLSPRKAACPWNKVGLRSPCHLAFPLLGASATHAHVLLSPPNTQALKAAPLKVLGEGRIPEGESLGSQQCDPRRPAHHRMWPKLFKKGGWKGRRKRFNPFTSFLMDSILIPQILISKCSKCSKWVYQLMKPGMSPSQVCFHLR